MQFNTSLAGQDDPIQFCLWWILGQMITLLIPPLQLKPGFLPTPTDVNTLDETSQLT